MRHDRPSDVRPTGHLQIKGGPTDGAGMRWGDTARKRFDAALESAGLGRLRVKDDPIVLHDLRHTFGTLAVQAFPLSDVKAMIGHAGMSTTMNYVHHVPETNGAARLTALLEPRERPSDRRRAPDAPIARTECLGLPPLRAASRKASWGLRRTRGAPV